MKIGFFGVGHMGGPMAANLVKAGHEVAAFDLVPALLAAAVNDGVKAAESAAEAVQGADVIVSMLPSAAAVRGLYLGDSGVLQHIDKSALIIDCSTIDADTARDVSGIAREQGRVMIDAPVSGGVGGAKAGTLTFICGGESDAIERARPVLECMGAQVFRAGDNGAGQLAKICNNMLLAIHMIGTAEAMKMAEKLGLDPQKFYEISSQSSGYCWSLNAYTPMPGVGVESPADKDYKGGFATGLMLKDLRLAMEAAQTADASTPLGAHAKELYEQFAKDNAGLDFSAIIRTL